MKKPRNVEKALTFAVEICNRDLELSILGNLGKLFYSLGEHVMAERYLLRALLISLETGNTDKEFSCYCNLTREDPGSLRVCSSEF